MQNNMKEMSLSDFLLVLFEKMREKKVNKVRGRVKLQKLIFIIAKEFKLPKKFDYFLHTYGPYSSTLQEEIDTLVTFRLMEEKVSRQRDYLRYDYSLTRKGISAARQILKETSQPTREIIDRMTERTVELNKLALTKLIDNAYEHLNKR